MVIPGHNPGNSQVSVNRTIGPTLVSFQFQDHDFPSLSGARIVRIATHPDYQGVRGFFHFSTTSPNSSIGKVSALKSRGKGFDPRTPHTKVINAPRSEKIGLRGFRPGLTQTGLYNHTRWLEA